MKAEKLSKRQQQIFDYIRNEIDEKGYPPSVREIADAVGLSSPSTVQSHLKTLEDKGYIKRDTSKPRALIVTSSLNNSEYKSHSPRDLERKVTELPVLGQVAAGLPVLAEQNVEETMFLPISFVGDANSFLLKVRGESMIEAGIYDGDYVVVKEQPIAQNGQIVVALLDDEATVKTFYREGSRIRLQPENASMEPIYCTEPRIIGVVTALFRSL